MTKDSLKIEPKEEKIGSNISLDTFCLLTTIFNGLLSLLLLIIIVDPSISSKFPILILSNPSIPRFPRTFDTISFI